jgi:hypothetical protein
MNNQEQIKKLQDVDALDIAEKLVGESYKTNEDVGFLGMALSMKKTEILNELLDKNNDTRFSEKTEIYLKKVLDFGFKIIYEEDFINTHDNKTSEKQYILWHEKFSILLNFDTFFGSRNGAKFYYNWSPNNENGYGRYTSSGGYRGFYFTSDFSQEKPYNVESPKWKTNEGQSWEDFSAEQKEWSLGNKKYIEENNLRAVWSGDHDAREAIKNNISLLYENGVFLEKWINVPFLWLVNYSETDDKNGYDYEEINKIKISKFPKEIREKMGFVD